METLKQAKYALKTESVKNRTACSGELKGILMYLQKF
jgi:hypothetical protein